MNSRLPAFTIVEAMMAVAISAAAMYIFYANLNLFGRMQVDIMDEGFANTQAFGLSNDLQADLIMANDIAQSSKGVQFIQPNDTVQYQFFDEGIIRTRRAHQGASQKFANGLQISRVDVEKKNRYLKLTFLNKENSTILVMHNL